MNLLNFITTPIGLVLISAIGATLLPSPTDWAHFSIQNYLYRRKLSRLEFELVQIFDWYILDSLWYIVLLFVVYYLSISNTTSINSVTLVSTVISLGAVVGIIGKFVMSSRKF